MATSNLKIYYQNTRGLRTKTNTFKRNLSLNSYDIVIITETWLLDSIGDSELFDERYVVWRRDRNYTATRELYGGGVLIAVRRELPTVARPEWHSSAEDLWVSVIIKHRGSIVNIHFCVLYLCNENFGFNFHSQLINFTDKLSHVSNSRSNDYFVIVGDFNMKDISWSSVTDDQPEPTGISGEAQIYFFDTLLEAGLHQYNYCYNINNRVLDWVLCNNDVSITACDDSLVPEDAHHKSLCIVMNSINTAYLKASPRSKYIYRLGDYININSSLAEINWEECLFAGSLEEAVNAFYTHLYKLIDKYVPKKYINSRTFPAWYTSPLKKILKEKFKYLNKFHTYGNTGDYSSFSTLRSRAKHVEDQCFKNYIKTIEDSITVNPKYFWTYVKSNKKECCLLPPTLSYEGRVAETGNSVCDLFSEYFQGNFLSSSSQHHHISRGSIPKQPDNITISHIEITGSMVENLLKSVDLTKGPGPDRIDPLFIKLCYKTLSVPLTILYNRSMQEGIVPKIWKSAFITPVHKSGSKNEVKNYRPISKLCIFAKILERIVYEQVYNALKSTFITEQHGFLPNRSTATNLLSFINYVTDGMDGGGQVDAIFTDFCKAFDRIDHRILLKKLLAAGIHGNLYRWFSSYIENRSQMVVSNGYASSWITVPSGVPQGSLLGPLLFNIFINDVGSCFRFAKFLLYADDMKIFLKIKTLADCQLLQADLCRFVTYCQVNKLDLNILKCYSIKFTRKFNVIQYDYQLMGINLDTVNEIRDLGITHDCKLTYEKHIDNMVKKARKSLGFIKRQCSQFNSIKLIKILYCSYVRSNLEYCSQVWNPLYEVYTNRLEKIQANFLKYVQFKCKVYDEDYNSNCSKHHILPLKVRRLIADAVFLSKLLNFRVDSPQLLGEIGVKAPISTRRKCTLLVPHCATNFRQNSFFVRCPQEMNRVMVDLPDFDLFVTSPEALRNMLTRRWMRFNNSES